MFCFALSGFSKSSENLNQDVLQIDLNSDDVMKVTAGDCIIIEVHCSCMVVRAQYCFNDRRWPSLSAYVSYLQSKCVRDCGDNPIGTEP